MICTVWGLSKWVGYSQDASSSVLNVMATVGSNSNAAEKNDEEQTKTKDTEEASGETKVSLLLLPYSCLHDARR